ncbi:MAG: hypothetical protein H5T41_06980 [Methanomassiliicoccales archaeon]|nr:hypothetical protein [Methanomassiliicoccales archaeon]
MPPKHIKFLIGAIAVILIAPLLSSSASADGGMMPNTPTPQSGNGMGMGDRAWNWSDGQMWHDGMGFMHGGDQQHMEEQMREMMQEGMRYALFASFSYSNGVADGYFIDFFYDEMTGTVTDYTLKFKNETIRFFDRILIDDFDPDAPVVRGAVLHADNGSVQIIIHDNPTGMYHVVSNVTRVFVSFQLADDIEITRIVGSGIGGQFADREAVILSKGSARAIIATDDGTITTEMGSDGTFVNVTTEGNHIMFRAIPAFANRSLTAEEALFYAIVQNRLGCEISLLVRNGSAMYDIMEYHHQFRVKVMSAYKNRIALEVSSENHEGKLVLLNIDENTIEMKKANLIVKIDGKTIKETTKPLEVLFASGSGESDAMYTVLHNDKISQILIYVPSFSTHTIEIESVSIFANIFSPVGIGAILSAVAVVCISAIVLIKKRQ